jgi:hypothetical protein
MRADWFTRCETWPLLADYVRYAELSTRLSREMRGIAVSDPRFERAHFERSVPWSPTGSAIDHCQPLNVLIGGTTA